MTEKKAVAKKETFVPVDKILDKAEKEYMIYKRKAAEGFFYMGKTLFNLKDKIAHGHWLDFLDNRVKESARTAQRYITLYKTYAHFEKNEEAFKIICELGPSHLDELRKLPSSFKKEITIIRLDDDKEEHPIKMTVLDEDKVVEFLNSTAPTTIGDEVIIKNMTADEMAKQIKEAQGIFEPTIGEHFDNMKNADGNQDMFGETLHPEDEDKPLTLKQLESNNAVKESRNIVRDVIKGATQINETVCILNKNLFELKEYPEHIFSLDVKMRSVLKRELRKINDNMAGTQTYLIDLLDKV